jgi:hypothetical protein
MKHLIVIALLALTACAAEKAPSEDVTLSQKVKAACEAEGGCSLFTRQAFEAKLEDAFTAGFHAGADAEAKRRGAL